MTRDARGTRRWTAWLAVALFAVSLGMVAFTLLSLVVPGGEALPDRPSALDVLVVSAVMLSYPLVGSIIAIRRPENAIGWLLLVLGIGFTASFFSTDYIGRALISGWPLPGPEWVSWFSTWSLVVVIAIAFGYIPLLFPTGTVPSPRWVPLAWAIGIVALVGSVATALDPTSYEDLGLVIPNPVGVPALGRLIEIVNALYLPALALLGLLSVASLVLRFRRSRGLERQQLRWFLLATSSFLVMLVAGFATQLEWVFMLALVAAAGIPTAAGIAILRYRLYEIDRLVSRTLAYAVLTAILAAAFVVTNLALQALLANATGSSTLTTAVATLVVATLFSPVRSRVQRLVDRRFNRTRGNAERVAATLATQVRDQVDLDRLRAAITAAADEAVAPAAATVWLRPTR